MDNVGVDRGNCELDNGGIQMRANIMHYLNYTQYYQMKLCPVEYVNVSSLSVVIYVRA